MNAVNIVTILNASLKKSFLFKFVTKTKSGMLCLVIVFLSDAFMNVNDSISRNRPCVCVSLRAEVSYFHKRKRDDASFPREEGTRWSARQLCLCLNNDQFYGH